MFSRGIQNTVLYSHREKQVPPLSLDNSEEQFILLPLQNDAVIHVVH